MSRILEHEVQGDLGAKENRAGEGKGEKREKGGEEWGGRLTDHRMFNLVRNLE